MELLRSRTAAILAAFVLTTACDSSPGPLAPRGDPDNAPQVDIVEAVSLIAGLDERDFELRFQGRIEAPIFPVPADLYENDGEDLRFYGFSSMTDARAAMETVSADGRTVDGEPVPFTGPIHFYQAERLVVVYLGSSSALRGAISNIMGGQVAGDE